MTGPQHNDDACSFCNGRRLTEIANFGEVALAGAFLKPENFDTERKYLLRLWFCHDCYAVQVADHAPPEELFNANYFYFSSSIGTLRDHFQNYAREIAERFVPARGGSTLEFGCNDGVLLRPLADQGVETVIGVDPASNVVATIDDPRVTVVNDFFNEAVAEKIVADHGKVDVVMANNVYAHISDIQGTTRAIHDVLKDDGVFVFEVHYLGKVVDELQYDMIYHEHLYYYSVLSAMKHFERYGMMIFDVKPIPIHAGSIRCYVCKNGSMYSDAVTDRLKAFVAEERRKGFDKVETFHQFSARIAAHREELRSILKKLRSQGAAIAGYGASGRANTVIQYCGLDRSDLDFMIDDAPAKLGFFTPGSHFEIRSSAVLKEPDPPQYVLVFAWSFFDEICRRNAEYIDSGGAMIVPLPEVRIATATDR